MKRKITHIEHIILRWEYFSNTDLSDLSIVGILLPRPLSNDPDSHNAFTVTVTPQIVLRKYTCGMRVYQMRHKSCDSPDWLIQSCYQSASSHVTETASMTWPCVECFQKCLVQKIVSL